MSPKTALGRDAGLPCAFGMYFSIRLSSCGDGTGIWGLVDALLEDSAEGPYLQHLGLVAQELQKAEIKMSPLVDCAYNKYGRALPYPT